MYVDLHYEIKIPVHFASTRPFISHVCPSSVQGSDGARARSRANERPSGRTVTRHPTAGFRHYCSRSSVLLLLLLKRIRIDICLGHRQSLPIWK